MSHENNLEIQTQGHFGRIGLDRASSLNALSLPMIQGIIQQLEIWRDNPSIQAVLIDSNSPKAFCAGGDIRFLYDSYQSGDIDYRDYFTAEYQMLTSIRKYPKTVVVLLDGYVLGGGMGLSQACHIRVSSEKSRFAMPETAIGYFPDVGATHFLSQRDEIGVYMALSSEQISSADAFYLKFIDVHVASERLPALKTDLLALANPTKLSIEQLIAQFSVAPATSEIQSRAACIKKHFSHQQLSEIEQSLAQETNPDDQAWAAKILAILQQRSLVAMQTSLKLQQVGRNLSQDQTLQLERELQDVWFELGDLIEGVRALIIDKDKQPQWQSHNPKLEQHLTRLLAAVA